jgi:hypothetical protein
MKLSLLTKLALAAATAAFFTGCITHRTVTREGRTVKSGYVVKAPFQSASD